MRDKPLNIVEEIKEVLEAVPLLSPFYKGEHSRSVRLDTEDYLQWTRDSIYELDRVNVKTPLLDQIEVKLKSEVKQYKELRPIWLISLIKALKGLHITDHDVRNLSQSEVAFRRRPVIQTVIKGTMDDWLDRMPPENFEDRDQEVDNFLELFENELLKDFQPNISLPTDKDENISQSS